MTLFGLHEACWMLAVVGLLATASAVAWAARLVSSEMQRRGVAKSLLFVALSIPLAFWAGGKGGGIRAPSHVPNRTGSSLHRYFAPTNFVADAEVFTRPTNAVTPTMWTRHSVSDDFQVAAQGWVAGVCGVVTTQPWGIDAPEAIEDGHVTLAPLYATNAFLLGTSDFWAVTNECSKTFVWKDIAFNRDPSNLVSFAATIYEWGDIEFSYGNVPEGGFSSFVKIGPEMLDTTQYAVGGLAVKIEKNLEQDDEWWLENYPEICYTNAAGELVFDYDTNEWYFVECLFASDAYNRAYDAYKEKARALSNDVVRIEKYTVMVETKRDPLAEDDSENRNPDLIDKYIDMQVKRYGEHVGMNGTAIDELPEGVSPEDVEIFTEPNGTVTNIFHWIIDDNSRVVAKIGQSPNPEDFGLDEHFIPLAVRNYSSGRFKISLKFAFTVETGSTVRFKENGKIIYTWAQRGDTTGSYIVPCRSGLVYDAHAYKGFASFGFSNDTERIEWRYDDDTRHCVNFHCKHSLSIGGVSFETVNFSTARADMTPPVRNGSYSWTSSPNITTMPIAGGRRAGLFLENGDAGFVKCVWDNGESGKWNLCATGEVSVVANPGYTNLTQFVGFNASPHVLVYEDAHLGTDGSPVPATSNLLSSLSCSYAGNRAGLLELSKISGSEVSLSENGSPVSLPYQWGVAGGGNDPARIFSVGGLHAGDAAEFRLRFTSDIVPGGIDYYATIHAVGLEVEAERSVPEEKHRRVFGPREPFLLRVSNGDPNGTWEYLNTNGTGNSFGASATVLPANIAAKLVIYGETHFVPISVVAPAGCVGTNAVPMADADWLEVSTNILAVGEIGAGLRIDLKLLPDYVSFEGLRTMEGYADASDLQGYFQNVVMTNTSHDVANGAWRVNIVQEGNNAGIDRAGGAYRVGDLPQPWVNGSYSFAIPFYWWVDGSSQTNQFATNVQTFRLFANGDAEVSKFGWTAHRGTNGVQTVTGGAQQ